MEEARQLKFGATCQSLLNQPSKFSKEIQEGLYIRFESKEHVMFRVKIRRKTFVCGRTDFDSKVINNKLA